MKYNIDFQIAAFAINLIVACFFFVSKRLPTRSNKLFSILLVTVFASLFLDMLSVIAIVEQDYFGYSMNRVISSLYQTSLLFYVLLLFMYIYFIARKKVRVNYGSLVKLCIPFLLAFLSVWILPVGFFCEGRVVYSYGYGNAAMYVVTTFYVFAALLTMVRHHKQLPRRLCAVIVCIVVIEAVCGTLQICNPEFLLTGFCISLITAILFMSIENPGENLDPSTGVYSNAGFVNIASVCFLKEKPFSVVVVEITDFQRVSAAFGMKTAQQAIRILAKEMSVESRYVSRLDQNRLAAVFECGQEEAFARAERVRRTVSASHSVGEIEYRFAVNCCFVSFPQDVASVNNLNDAINYLLYEGRDSGKDTIVKFSEELIKKSKRLNQVEELLAEAIRDDGLEVYYQPIYSVRGKRFNSAEALVRLKNSSIGYISPEEFIPIAERNGLILKLGMIVFEKVCVFAMEHDWAKWGLDYIEINLSGVQCMQTDLAEQLRDVMQKHRVPPQFINLEVTETAAMGSDETLIRSMEKVIAMGSSFSLDDFGSGYSSIQYIVKFPFSIIKLDKGIVWAFFDPDNSKAKTVLSANITMMKQLNMKIVAEGVETKEQVATLSLLGVDYLQGYYFSKPIQAEAFVEFIGKAALENQQKQSAKLALE